MLQPQRPYRRQLVREFLRSVPHLLLLAQRRLLRVRKLVVQFAHRLLRRSVEGLLLGQHPRVRILVSLGHVGAGPRLRLHECGRRLPLVEIVGHPLVHHHRAHDISQHADTKVMRHCSHLRRALVRVRLVHHATPPQCKGSPQRTPVEARGQTPQEQCRVRALILHALHPRCVEVVGNPVEVLPQPGDLCVRQRFGRRQRRCSARLGFMENHHGFVLHARRSLVQILGRLCVGLHALVVRMGPRLLRRLLRCKFGLEQGVAPLFRTTLPRLCQLPFKPRERFFLRLEQRRRRRLPERVELFRRPSLHPSQRHFLLVVALLLHRLNSHACRPSCVLEVLIALLLELLGVFR